MQEKRNNLIHITLITFSVLELGAGGALPSLVCYHNNAEKVIITDYPDADLIENITFNVNLNAPKGIDSGKIVVMVIHVLALSNLFQGHLWGKQVPELQKKISADETNLRKFDVIILSDLIFNHTCHYDLLTTCKQALANDGKVTNTLSKKY